jgi:hypothetical protein
VESSVAGGLFKAPTAAGGTLFFFKNPKPTIFGWKNAGYDI